MPAQTKKGLLSGYKGNKAIAKHAAEKTTNSFVPLPVGITGGVAVLQELGFAVYETGDAKGKPYLRGVAIVESPEEFKGRRIQGLQTYLRVPFCAIGGKDNEDENIDRALKAIRSLGGEECTDGMTDGEQIEALCDTLQNMDPPIRFNFTTTPMKAQRDDPENGIKKGDVTGVWENWNGTRGLENYTPPDSSPTSSNHVKDNSGGGTEEKSLEVLGKWADDGDKDAKDELEKLALESGLSQVDVDDAPSWEWVADAVKARQGGSDDDKQEADDVEYTPTKGAEVGYIPKGKKKAIVCKITAVDEKGKTVNLSDADKNKYTKVEWTALITE